MIVAVDDGFVSIVDEVAVSVGGKSVGDRSSAHGERAGIKDVDLAGLQIGNGLVNCLLGAGSDIGAELGQSDGVLVEAFGPVGVEGLALLHGGQGVLIVL